MRIVSERDAAASDVTNALQSQQPIFSPIVGFSPGHVYFTSDERLITFDGRFLCEIDLRECERLFVDMRARIITLTIAPKLDLLAVCVDYQRRGSTVFVKESGDLATTRNSFLVG